MDNLTHTLTGLLMSRAGLNRFHPKAAPLLLVAANMPDIDAVTLFQGIDSYFHHHRGITHAIIMVPVMALVATLITRLFFRRAPFPLLSAWLIAIPGVASHLLLDWTNPYGIRLFLPFNSEWPVLSITSVVDIWIWTTLIVAAAAPFLGRLVSSEIGARPGKGQGWAIAGLTVLTFYDLGRSVLHERALAVQSSVVYEGQSPRRVLAYPTSLNPLEWKGVVETESALITQEVNLLRGVEPQTRRVFFKPESSPPIEAAARLAIFERLMGFSRALLWRTTPADGREEAVRVEASDLFFGFTATAVLDERNQVVRSEFRF